MDTGRKGRAIEEWVAGELERQGYRIVGRNYRCKAGELDLIACDGDVLCFVEVRSRADDVHGTPLETIDGRKRSRVISAARWFVLENPQVEEMTMRFDVVGVTVGPPFEMVLVRGAFEAAA
jgi:putative endonuclease